MREKDKNELTKIYEGQEVVFRENNGTYEVRVNEVARLCNWITTTKGKEYIRFNRVNEHLKTLGLPDVANGDFIPEWAMYPLIGKADNEKATQFSIWVGHVLVDLRTKGVVILDNAKNETIDFEKKFGKYRIRKTFSVSEKVIEDYKEFVELSKVEWKAKRLNNSERVKLSNIAISAIEDRISGNVLEMKPSEVLQLQELISEIKTDVIKLSNKKNGGDKTALTKEVKALRQQMENNSIPNLEEYVTLNVHGFSNNYMYKHEAGGTYKTDAFKAWIMHFPVEQLPVVDYWNVEWDKPVELFINYTAKAEHDIRNFDKSLIDIVFHEYGIDDNIVQSVHSKRVGTVSDYKDGKISIYIKNV